MKEQSVVIYTDYLEHLMKLPYEECGKLFLAILTYAKTGVRLDGLSPAADMAFSFISARIDRDKAKYEQACEKRRENGKKGGRPRKEEAEEEKKSYENAQISVILPEVKAEKECGNRPEKSEVAAFFKQHGFKASPKEFYEYYEAANWCTADGTPMKTWQTAAFMWEKREQKYKPAVQKASKSADSGEDASYDIEEYKRASMQRLIARYGAD